MFEPAGSSSMFELWLELFKLWVRETLCLNPGFGKLYVPRESVQGERERGPCRRRGREVGEWNASTRK